MSSREDALGKAMKGGGAGAPMASTSHPE